MARAETATSSTQTPVSAPAPEEKTVVESEDRRPTGHYDFDLAEFPLFRLYKNSDARNSREPLEHSDTITGRGGKPVERSWQVYPGPFGFGGQSTQVLLYDLFQLYIEQGAKGSQIQFGTLRSLYQRRGERNPSKRDYDRMRRDFDILCGYYFKCKNGFWDRKRQAYVDMNWRLFNSVFYFKSSPTLDGEELPFGFIEVSPVLQQIAKTRGFFKLGFERQQFYELKPLEQRLAIYLAKQFTSQKFHRRFVTDLARVLPVEAGRPRDVRAILKDAAQGLIEKKVRILESFTLEESRAGEWLATFHRGTVANRPYTIPHNAAEELSPQLTLLVDRIAQAIGGDEDRIWWSQCVRRLGAGAVDRALGQLKEARHLYQVKNPGGLLTKIFKDIATEAGIVLN